VKKAKRKPALRPDTTVMSEGREGREMYIRAMPSCCLASLKEATIRDTGGRRLLSLECPECGKGWRVTSSLDERILHRFATHGGPRVGGGYPAA
jgi:hypothetical protein